jgi:DNA-binding response OmpR family regulator
MNVGAERRLPCTILLVEDEVMLRQPLSAMLRKKGFAVLEADEGTAALELMRAHAAEIDLLLLDVTLPGISSREVFEQARLLRPVLKIVLTSAYSREAVAVSFSGVSIESFIRKPFRFAELMAVLQDALPLPSFAP